MNGKNRIECLTLSNFRGATTPISLQFDTEQSVVLLFGENGTGKSTIADALDFICNGRFGSVQLRSGTKPTRHIVASHARADELSVELKFGARTWHASLQGHRPKVTPSQPPQAFVLRRADIMRVTEDADSIRYKTLQSFITVPHIEAAESTLRSLYQKISKQLDKTSSQKAQAEAILRTIWEAEGAPKGDYLSWARSAVVPSSIELVRQRALTEALLKQLDETIAAVQRVDAAQIALEQTNAEHTALAQQMQQLSQQQPDAALISTLNEVQIYLQNHPDVVHCPVCHKPESHNSLLRQVEA